LLPSSDSSSSSSSATTTVYRLDLERRSGDALLFAQLTKALAEKLANCCCNPAATLLGSSSSSSGGDVEAQTAAMMAKVAVAEEAPVLADSAEDDVF
jgi:hypothetical protein